ncbi:MAG: CoB--CoM heterodisulfide reductase iron-sulfur subunit A family protein [Anaerolineales bacterium]|jgi:heterodisulfide reductase subunit A
MAFVPRVGVYICHCGINIAGTVEVKKVAEYAASLPGVAVAREYTYMCSDPGQELIGEDIRQLNLNRVVVASCSPRMHEPTFRAAVARAGLNPYCFEMANIREQCSWVHPAGREATEKAMQLVAAAVSKAVRLEPLEQREVSTIPAALVIGGGIAGLQSALDMASAGFPVALVERAQALGGHMADLQRTFPTLESAPELLNSVIERVRSQPLIRVLLGAQVKEISGFVGNFKAKVEVAGKVEELAVGSIVVATGFETFDARRKPELGYGTYPQVITTAEFEKLAEKGLEVNGKRPQSVVFIQCVGSRDQVVERPYCSRVCCMVTAKQARTVREKLPEAKVSVFYMDVRAFGKGFEEFYDETRKSGVLYRRGNPSEILRQGDRVLVRAEDTLLGERVEVEADLVVLAVGMQPRADSASLAGMLKLARSADGFLMEAHPKLRPVDTAMAGIFLAGCCQAPKDIAESIAQARAAAGTAMIPLMRGKVQVEAATSFVDPELCAGCGQCAQVCAFGALSLHPFRPIMTVNAVLCQGCGACATACPSGAINVKHFTLDQVMAQVETLSEFRPLAEKAEAVEVAA